VEWASHPSRAAERGHALYVTSDRELIRRLSAAQVAVCKPKEWFKFAAYLLGVADTPAVQPAAGGSAASAASAVSTAATASRAYDCKHSKQSLAPAEDTQTSTDSSASSTSSAPHKRLERKPKDTSIKASSSRPKEDQIDIDAFASRFLLKH